MKFIAIIAIALMLQVTFQVSCIPANYCMGCHDTTANYCTSCFNWGSGTVGARSTATASSVQNCIAARPAALATTNCKAYSTVASTATAKSNGNCVYCGKKYRTWNASTMAETCTDTALTGCTAVSNAEWTNCYTDTAGTVYSAAGYCKSGYYLSGTVNSAGYPTCTAGTLTNCSRMSTATTCTYCNSKYAVNTSSTCTSFTTDSNCSTLNSSNTCSTCWSAYYWNTTSCKLASSVLSVAFMAVAAFFFN